MKREVNRARTSGISVGRRPPDVLTDDRVTVRLPRAADALRVVEYGGDAKLLEGIWIAGPFPDSEVEAWASNVIAQALAGWRKEGGVHGGGLVIDEDESFLGLVYLTPAHNDAIEIAYGVAPPARGRGIATRALRLVTCWAVTHGNFASVELRIAEGHAASRRVAEKASFHLHERIETFIESTGETYTDLLYRNAPLEKSPLER